MKKGSAFQVDVSVFMPGHKDTSVKLRAGEHLFVLTDNGLEESGHKGPQEVLIITEHFGAWPVVAFGTKYPEEWRRTQSADHERMMKRVRREVLKKYAVFGGGKATEADHDQ